MENFTELNAIEALQMFNDTMLPTTTNTTNEMETTCLMQNQTNPTQVRPLSPKYEIREENEMKKKPEKEKKKRKINEKRNNILCALGENRKLKCSPTNEHFDQVRTRARLQVRSFVVPVHHLFVSIQNDKKQFNTNLLDTNMITNKDKWNIMNCADETELPKSALRLNERNGHIKRGNARRI